MNTTQDRAGVGLGGMVRSALRGSFAGALGSMGGPVAATLGATLGAMAVAAIAEQQTHHTHRTRGGDRLCTGCDQPASDVGVLTPVRVTHTTGWVGDADYCPECLELAELAVQRPGAAFGAASLPEFAKVERRSPSDRCIHCGISREHADFYGDHDCRDDNQGEYVHFTFIPGPSRGPHVFSAASPAPQATGARD